MIWVVKSFRVSYLVILVTFLSWTAHGGLRPAACYSRIPLPGDLKPLQERLSKQRLKGVMEEREVDTVARVDEIEGKTRFKRYHFETSVLIHAPLRRVKRILTDYRVLREVVPLVDSADFDAQFCRVDLRAGFMGFKLRSLLQFSEVGKKRIHFHIERYSFAGLDGDIFFESAGEKGTIVTLKGSKVGTRFGVSSFLLARMTEGAFGITARRMRSYIESSPEIERLPEKSGRKGRDHVREGKQKIPKPRRRL